LSGFKPTAEKSQTARASSDEAAPGSVLAWAERHRRIDGMPFSLERFAPLRDIYADDHPHIAIKKPAQRGVSEYGINLAVFALEIGARHWQTRKDGLNVAYLFPTVTALSDFSKERITGLASETPYLTRLFGATGSFAGITFKQIGRSYLYLRGAWSESALLSFAADLLILDEYDRMDPRAVALARRRLNASAVRREVDISTPTIPGRGIDALYAQSDRRVYEQPCPHCGDWVAYKFHRDVRADGEPWSVWQEWDAPRIRVATVTLHCPTCRAAISDVDRCAEGRWVARAPEIKSLRGYHVPALPFPMTDLDRLAVTAVNPDPGEQTEFWRSDLGEAFDAAGARITEAALNELWKDLPGGRAPAQGPWLNTTMGVDVGRRFHYRVSSTKVTRTMLQAIEAGIAPDERDLGGSRIVRAMGTVGTWEELTGLMAQFGVRRCVIDALPELHACREWAAKFPARVFRATYPNANAVASHLFALNKTERTLQINRTMALDAVYTAVANRLEHWPAEYARGKEIVDHLTSPVRVVQKDGQGQERATWENTGPDHFMHACAYDRVALATLLELPQDGKAGIFAQGGTKGWTR
jgi:hypothetical protein